MGGSNVAEIDGRKWQMKLSGRQVQLLAFMANVAHDDDEVPVFWGGWHAMAEALGMDIPPERKMTAQQKRKAIKNVNDHITVMRDIGAIAWSGKANPGRRSEYALTLDPNWTAVANFEDEDGDENGSRNANWIRVERTLPEFGTGKRGTKGTGKAGTTGTGKSGTTGTRKAGTQGTTGGITEENREEQHKTQVVKLPAAVENSDAEDDLAREILGRMNDLGISALREVDEKYPTLAGNDAARRIKAAEIIAKRERAKQKRRRA